MELIGCRREEIIRASGKTGAGVEEILRAIIERIPAPKGDPSAPLQALIFSVDQIEGIMGAFEDIVHLYGMALDGDTSFVLCGFPIKQRNLLSLHDLSYCSK